MQCLTALFAAVLCVFSSMAAPMGAKVTARADIISDYDKTDIMTDLADVIDVADYPKRENGSPQIVLMQEYCYSQKIFYKDHFGLYLYIYNPSEKELSKNKNAVNMATSYNAKGEPSSYGNKPLTVLSKTENNRFYKFKVDDSEILTVAKGYAAQHDGKRRYDFADITLTFSDGEKLDTSNLQRRYSQTYYYEGYAAGLDGGTESSLKCSVVPLETIVLDVEHANYRFEKELTTDGNTAKELNTVYFAVDDSYFYKYGALQAIKAEWYEYVTKPIFVTSDQSAYKALYDYIGKDIGTKNESLEWRVLWEQMSGAQLKNLREEVLKKFSNLYGLVVSLIKSDDIYFLKNYNGAMGELPTGVFEKDYYLFEGGESIISRMDWLINADNVSSTSDYKVTGEELEAYMKWYTSRFPDQEKLDGRYAAGLFEESIDEDRVSLLADPTKKRGYVVQEIEAGETQDLRFYAEQNFWDVVWNGVKEETLEVNPIIEITSKDLEGLTAKTFGEKYYISADQRAECFDYCKKQTANGKRAILFRFALTDYYASAARFDKDGNDMSPVDGYVAQETVFLDYKTISLTFRDELSVDTVIGVVSTPIDIVNGLDPAAGLEVKKGFSDWDWLGLFKILGTYVLYLIAGASVIAIVVGIIVGIIRKLYAKASGDDGRGEK